MIFLVGSFSLAFEPFVIDELTLISPEAYFSLYLVDIIGPSLEVKIGSTVKSELLDSLKNIGCL